MRSRLEIDAELDRLRDAVNAGGAPQVDGAYHALAWVLGEESDGPYEAFVAEEL